MVKPLRFDVTQRFARAYDQNGTMLGYVLSVGDAGEHAMLDSSEPSDLDVAREEVIVDATRARIKLSRMLAKDVTLSRRRKVVEVYPDGRADVMDEVIRWYNDVPYLLFPEGVEVPVPFTANVDDPAMHPVYGPGVLVSVIKSKEADQEAKATGLWRPIMGHISLAPLIEQGKFEVVEI